MEDVKAFESALMKKLSKRDIDKTFLKETTASIVSLRKEGFVIDQVYVKGRPRPDRILINGFIEPDFWRKFNDLGSVFSRVEMFPKGVIKTEGFQVNATISM